MFRRNFNKGFRAVVFPYIYCYRCKEKYNAYAKKCPNCHTVLTSRYYSKIKRWQNKANNVLLVLCGLLLVGVVASGVPFVIGLLLAFALYGLGLIVIHKIQSIINYFK